jgi:hypothetical protein
MRVSRDSSNEDRFLAKNVTKYRHTKHRRDVATVNRVWPRRDYLLHTFYTFLRTKPPPPSITPASAGKPCARPPSKREKLRKKHSPSPGVAGGLGGWWVVGGWWVGWLGWLVGLAGLVGWLGWLGWAGWLVGWLAGWAGWLVGWLGKKDWFRPLFTLRITSFREESVPDMYHSR